MKNVLIVMLMLAAVPVSANEWRCDATGGVMYSQRVIELPEDSGKLYCTLIGNPASPEMKQLVGWFNTNEDLARLKTSTHFNVLSTESAIFQRYAATTGTDTSIRLQTADGNVIYQASGKSIPLSAEGLANSIRTTCIRRQAQPTEPSINVHYHYQVPEKQQDKQPDVIIQDKKESMYEIPTWGFFVMGIVAVGAGIGLKWRKEFQAGRKKGR